MEIGIFVSADGTVGYRTVNPATPEGRWEEGPGGVLCKRVSTERYNPLTKGSVDWAFAEAQKTLEAYMGCLQA